MCFNVQISITYMWESCDTNCDIIVALLQQYHYDGPFLLQNMNCLYRNETSLDKYMMKTPSHQNHND